MLPEDILGALAHLSGLNFSSLDDFPHGVVEAPYHLLTETLIRCDAVGIGIPPLFRKGFEEGTLHLLPLQNQELTTQYALVSLKRYTRSPAVQVFKKYLIDTCIRLEQE